MKYSKLVLTAAWFLLGFAPAGLRAGSFEESFSDATSVARNPEGVVDETAALFAAQQKSAHPIPAAVLNRAKAIGIIKVTEAGAVLGGSGGEGVILARTGQGWSAPVFFHQGGGTLGLQLGAHVKRFIYVFNSDDAVKLFTGDEENRFKTLGQYTAGTDHDSFVLTGKLPEDGLLIYHQEDGVFAGATVGNALVGASGTVNRKTYGTEDASQILAGGVPAPAYAAPLQKELAEASSLQGFDKSK